MRLETGIICRGFSEQTLKLFASNSLRGAQICWRITSTTFFGLRKLLFYYAAAAPNALCSSYRNAYCGSFLQFSKQSHRAALEVMQKAFPSPLSLNSIKKHLNFSAWLFLSSTRWKAMPCVIWHSAAFRSTFPCSRNFFIIEIGLQCITHGASRSAHISRSFKFTFYVQLWHLYKNSVCCCSQGRKLAPASNLLLFQANASEISPFLVHTRSVSATSRVSTRKNFFTPVRGIKFPFVNDQSSKVWINI